MSELILDKVKFKLHPINGVQGRVFFKNGYGASIVFFDGSYGFEYGLLELAVLNGTPENYELCYDTTVTNDVVGHLKLSEVESILLKVQKLPPKEELDFSFIKESTTEETAEVSKRQNT